MTGLGGTPEGRATRRWELAKVPHVLNARKKEAVKRFITPIKSDLVGGLVAIFYFPNIFPYIGFLIIPIDELIFFRGVALAHQPVIQTFHFLFLLAFDTR